MSFIIKGLDMPKSCSECLLSDRYIDITNQRVYYCMVSDKECANGYEKRPPICPLIEIPDSVIEIGAKFILLGDKVNRIIKSEE